jgi:hypothetical protein
MLLRIHRARTLHAAACRSPAPLEEGAFTQLEYEGRIHGWSVRTASHRYIRWKGEGGGEELYDHRNDPREFRNLAGARQHGAVLAEHRRILDEGWRKALPPRS